MRPTRPLALFDDTHGQTHWSRTGFPSREWHTNLAGLAGLLFRRGLDCGSIRPHLLSDRLADARLLVLPTPTGYYNPAREQWEPLASSLLTAFEVREILRFLEGGGRLLAFAYRFGDAFTQTNLDSLFVPLGCQLNPDAVIDLTRLREMHPLRFYFDTPREALPLHWSVDRVATVRWRSLATFTLRQDAPVQPLAFSPGGGCISFDCVHRRISFLSLPIAVAGRHGQGRFVLFGGPHAFETGPLGLLDSAHNRRFLANVLNWLLADEITESEVVHAETLSDVTTWIGPLTEQYRELSQIEDTGEDAGTVAFVERLLQQTGVLKALARPSWMP